MKKRKYSDLAIYRRIFVEARPFWPHLVAIFFLNLLATPLALLVPVPLKLTVDSVLGDRPLPATFQSLLPERLASSPAALLAVMAALVLFVGVAMRLQGLGTWVAETYTGEKLVLGFRSRLFRHIQRLSFTYHDAKGIADPIYRVQYDAKSIQNVAIYGLTPFLTSAIKLVAMLYVIALIDVQLAIVALIVSPPILLIIKVSRRHLRNQWREAKSLESSAMSVVQESLAAVRVVKAFGQEERESRRYQQHANKSLLAQIKAAFAEGGYGLLIGVTTAGGTAAVLYIGATHVLRGSLSLGNLLLVMGYLTQFYEPLKTIGRKIGSLQKSFASAERAFAILDHEPDVEERDDAISLAEAKGRFSFQNVSFAYESTHHVLRDVSFDVPAGARVGIAGRTGIGKTTLVSLIPRFYDPDDGTILLDGTDIRDFKIADLRNQFSIVLQEPVLFSTSIAENIAYGRPDASSEEIVAAAKAANAHDFIAGLPEGYDTEVGNRGMRLSGGERQRISLARAFLKDAPILVLDEPTSSVDNKTEAGIMEAMERLMKGRTTFIIAHRLSTLENCDIKFEIRDGRIARVSSFSPMAGTKLASEMLS